MPADLEKTLELMRKFGVRRLKTTDLELELEPAVEAQQPAASIATDLPTDEQLLLWSTPNYEGPVPGQTARQAQALQTLMDAAIADGNDVPPEPNKDTPKS